MSDKILFTDIDGVLNNKTLWHQTFNDGEGIENPANYLSPKMIDILNRIIESTDCDVVISSSWRTEYSLNNLKKYMVDKGFLYPNKIIDVTPNISATKREYEVSVWLLRKTLKAYAILDDVCYGFEEVHPNQFIRTDSVFGLTESDADKVIKILNI